MIQIEPLTEKYFWDFQKYAQELYEYIVSCEVWEDDMVIYDTSEDTKNTLHSYASWELIILIARQDSICCWFILGRIRKDSSKGSKIEYYGSVWRLYVAKKHRGQWIATKLLIAIENEFTLFKATHMSVSVFAPNTWAYMLYKKYGFEDRLITLGKRIGNPNNIVDIIQ